MVCANSHLCIVRNTWGGAGFNKKHPALRVFSWPTETHQISEIFFFIVKVATFTTTLLSKWSYFIIVYIFFAAHHWHLSFGLSGFLESLTSVLCYAVTSPHRFISSVKCTATFIARRPLEETAVRDSRSLCSRHVVIQWCRNKNKKNKKRFDKTKLVQHWKIERKVSVNNK